MMKSKKNNLHGFILPTTLFFMVSSLSIIWIYFEWLDNKLNQLEYRIATTKAKYNAQSGVSEKAYPYLILSSFEKDTILAGRVLDDYEYINMGSYREVDMSFNLNTSERIGQATGLATWGVGEQDTVYRQASISAMPETLGKYMYFTDSEKAGGAPFTFGPPLPGGDRRDVSFWYLDELEGVVQTNGQIVFSQFGNGCADFSDATWLLTYGWYEQNQDYGACSQGLNGLWNFQEVDTLSSCPLKFPPPGYETMKNNASITYDSGRKIGSGASKDTLIMTDIEFFNDGLYTIKQWWYLMPPHLRHDIPLEAVNSPHPQHLNGTEVEGAGQGNPEDDIDINLDTWSLLSVEDRADILNGFCDAPDDPNDLEAYNINTCKPYLDSLRSYHAKRVSTSNLGESYIDPSISYSHGIAGQHFDLGTISGDPQPSNLLIEDTRFYTSPIVIYIIDGPVRVHGDYQGKYSIVSDEYTLYRRHAWNDSLNGTVPMDTIWNNIWLIDDLINADTNGTGNMGGDLQPNENCRGGSFNRMGLVSGANIIVANTRKNGAGNGGDTGSNPDISGIKINAGMIALNESFVVHYWQNSTHDADYPDGAQPIATNVGGSLIPNYSPPANGYYNTWWSDFNDSDYRRWEDYPPWGDSRGYKKAIEQNYDSNIDSSAPYTQRDDKRGTILLWGGVVQKFRGYVYRNPNSPYEGAYIGFQAKDYNYDSNLKCEGPPFYPYIECEGGNGELSVRITSSY